MTKVSLRRIAILGLTIVCAALFSACSNSKKEDLAYKNAKAPPPLEVPPDLISPTEDKSNAIPELPAHTTAPAEPTTSTPPATTEASPPQQAQDNGAGQGGAATSAIHIEKQGAQRWLVVPQPKDQVWQRTKDFLQEKGFSLAKADQDSGMLETDWRGGDKQAAPAGDLNAAMKSVLKDKYKLRVEDGRVAGTSEVTVSHEGLERITKDGKPQWQPRMDDPMPAAAMLDQLRAYLSSEASAPPPQETMPAVKADITTDPNTSVSTLTLNEAFDRAWRRIGLALGRNGFVIEDRDRSKGLYMIRLGSAFKEDAKAGFVARLFGSNGGDPDKRYRVHVDDRGDESAVVVEHPGGAPVHTSIGERILSRLIAKSS